MVCIVVVVEGGREEVWSDLIHTCVAVLFIFRVFPRRGQFSEDKFPSGIITQPPLLHECPGTTSHHLNSLHIALTLRSSTHPLQANIQSFPPSAIKKTGAFDDPTPRRRSSSPPQDSLQNELATAPGLGEYCIKKATTRGTSSGLFFLSKYNTEDCGTNDLVLRDRDGGSGELLGLRWSYTLLMPWKVDML